MKRKDVGSILLIVVTLISVTEMAVPFGYATITPLCHKGGDNKGGGGSKGGGGNKGGHNNGGRDNNGASDPPCNCTTTIITRTSSITTVETVVYTTTTSMTH